MNDKNVLLKRALPDISTTDISATYGGPFSVSNIIRDMLERIAYTTGYT